MSEDKPKVIVIKKPQAPVKENPQVKEAPNKEEKKVVVVKKKIVTVKAKIKEEKKEELPETPAVAAVAPQTPNKQVKKDNISNQNKSAVKPTAKVSQAPAANRNIIKGERLSSPLHFGPVVIKPNNLPPVPGQKVVEQQPKEQAKPRVAGVVGGRPVRTPGQRFSNNNRFQGQNNRSFNRDQKDGQNQGFNNKNSFNNRNSGGRSLSLASAQRAFATLSSGAKFK